SNFFIHDASTTSIYTLSLHDALPIFQGLPHESIRTGQFLESVVARKRMVEINAFSGRRKHEAITSRYKPWVSAWLDVERRRRKRDRKSTRLNSSHVSISYAVFCLKKK